MAQEDPLISVIINCKNGEKYLFESVNSVLNQSYENFEIIFFDNNSVDKSKNNTEVKASVKTSEIAACITLEVVTTLTAVVISNKRTK